MKVRFWGVRGSVPTPGPSTVRYGGNTACIEVRGDNNELLIIDAGTGLRELGNYLIANDLPNGAIDVNILLTHTHWDHIQGFPFFAPAFIPSSRINFLGPVSAVGKTLQEIVAGQMSYSYFPINLQELRGGIYFKELQGDQSLDLGPFHISTCYLNHPILCLGYRITYADKTLVTMYDSEPYRNVFVSSDTGDSFAEDEFDITDDIFREAEECVQTQNQKIIDFASDSDFLVYDAQYTSEEYKSKIGWGHSSMDYAINAAIKTRAKKLALFHHEPVRSDDEFDILQASLIKKFKIEHPDLELPIFFARERLEVVL